MWDTFLIAIALMLILEGMMPFLSPRTWREAFKKLIEMGDGQIRFIGLSAMMVGLLLLMLLS
ncbi:MAG: hypothetical protein NMNS01_01680 [Nitrosomonas sp.]|jgi:uncharacterized protein|nr:MAG: hypothetical protein NMNS01_01680 [Nitrosomonas sp.]